MMDSISRAFPGVGGCIVSWGWVRIVEPIVPAGRGACWGQELGKWVSGPASRREQVKHPLLGWL